MATQVRYILEAIYPEKTEKFILPNVGKIDFSHPHAVHTTWSLGELPTHQYSGVRSQKITISGRSGLKANFEPPGLFDFSNVAADMSGPAMFRMLEQFLARYMVKCYEAQQSRTTLPKLVLKALWENKNLYVELENYNWVRDKSSSRLSYEYTLELAAYGSPGEIEPEGPQKWLSGATKIADKVTEAINYANVAVASTTRLLNDFRTTMDRFRQPMRAVANLGQQARLAIYEFDRLAKWPSDFMRDFWYAVYECTAVAFDAWMAIPGLDKTPARIALLDVMQSIGDARRASLGALGLHQEKLPSYTYNPEKLQGFLDSADTRLSTRPSALTMSNPLPGGYSIQNGQLVQVYTVKSGDTLQSIAQSILGDKTLWVTIAELNGMSSDAVLADGSPLIPGALLFVPVPGNGIAISKSPNDLYGTDLMLSNDGDLVLSGQPGVDSEDIKLISGTNNLMQALKYRMLTIRGTNGTFPDYGMPAIIGDRATVDVIADAALEVRAQFTAEKRVDTIGDVTVVNDGDELIVNAVVKPVVGQQFLISIPVASQV